MSTKVSDTLTVTTDDGAEIPLRRTTSRGGTTFWGTLNTDKSGKRYYHRTGVNVAGLIAELPSSVEVCGVTVPLKRGFNEKGRPKVSGSAQVNIEGVGVKHFAIRITEMGPETYNIDGCINGGSGGLRVVTSL